MRDDNTIIKLRYKEDYRFIANIGLLDMSDVILVAFNEMIEKMIPLYGPLSIHSSCITYRGEDFPPYISAGFTENLDELMSAFINEGASLISPTESYILLRDKKENYYGSYVRNLLFLNSEDMNDRLFYQNKNDKRRKEFIQKIIDHPKIDNDEWIAVVREMRWWPCDDDIKEQIKRHNFLGADTWYDIPSVGVFLEPPSPDDDFGDGDFEIYF